MFRYMTIIMTAALLFSGCVASDPPKQVRTPDQKLVDQHIARGVSFEDEMLYSSALEQYELALTIDPENKTAVQHKNQILSKLQDRAQEHYEKGVMLDEQGRYSDAKKQYLSALQNWPDHEQAKKRLLPGGVIDENSTYITHKLAYGESVSKLGLIYYGDLQTYPVIGKFNNLEDVTRVQVGKELKIPVVPGTTLSDLQQRQADYLASRQAEAAGLEKLSETAAPKDLPATPDSVPSDSADIKTAAAAPPEAASSDPPETASSEKELTAALEAEKEMTAPLEIPVYGDEKTADTDAVDSAAFDQAVVLFHQKKYDRVIPLFEDLLKADPDNNILEQHLFESHFQNGLIQFNSEQYLPAKASFESALFYDKSCDMCPGYIEKCETSYKEKHYNLGIHYFGKEQLEKAIDEWKLVRNLDPDYKDVTPNLKKAELLYERLESIKKSTTQ
jgi:tetratricopeptide (TPR) repeat protein